jgi:excisionase family DNA binding protein
MIKTCDELHNIAWLSDLLDVPQRTIYSWRQRGEGPPAYRVGKHLRYRRADVEAWLERQHDNGGHNPAGGGLR